MGCAESHEVHHHHHHGDYQGLYQSRTSLDLAPQPVSLEYTPSAASIPYRMGQQTTPVPPFAVTSDGGGPSSSSSAISLQHERLILEFLPFKGAPQFRKWLSSPNVRGSWNEFCRDFLLNNVSALEQDKNKTTEAAKSAINSKNPKYMTYHPHKFNWTPEDHHIRFIVTVVADNMLNGLWSDGEWCALSFNPSPLSQSTLSLSPIGLGQRLTSQLMLFRKKHSIQITKAIYEVLSLLRRTASGAEQLPPRYED